MSRGHVYESQQREMAQLRAQNQELMHINNEWDKEYREQREAFRRYKADAQLAQTENHALIVRLKEKVGSVEEERDRLEDELSRYQRELHSLRERLAMAESLRGSGGGGGGEVAGLEEELSLLRQQVKAYEEDFDAEKREKERLRDEKQSAAVRYEAERTSLQLRLDRCQADLAHFTAEANRLAQQLKLKNQYEEDRYREHLENKGFVSRSPSGLPPLDPYVEIDQNQLPPFASGGNRLDGRRFPPRNGAALPNGHAPRPLYQLPGNDPASRVGSGRVSPGRRRSGANSSPAAAAFSSGSCRLVARGLDKEEVQSAPVNSDGLSSSSGSSSDSGSSVDSDGAEGLPPPPLPRKGRHTCPRCARGFLDKTTFQQHRDRCLA